MTERKNCAACVRYGNHQLLRVVRVDHTFAVGKYETALDGKTRAHMKANRIAPRDVENQLRGEQDSVVRLNLEDGRLVRLFKPCESLRWDVPLSPHIDISVPWR